MTPSNPWLTGARLLTGPTASGKTELGVLLAQRLGAEIVSLDSMALYRGLEIGVAKPSAAQRAAVPHHLIDMVDPWDPFSVADYLRAAERAVAEIRGRGKEVLFVGGTPLYLKALLRGLFDGPPADAELRRELNEVTRALGAVELHRRLEQVDPSAAARLHPNDTRRLIRALEVFAKTGEPISRRQTQFDRGPRTDATVWTLGWPREELRRRIARRVQAMFAAGWVDEVRRLLSGPTPPSQTAWQALGYAEIAEHLQGERDLSATQELIVVNTRRFAKRQGTWFRSLAECVPVEMGDDATVEQVADRLLATL